MYTSIMHHKEWKRVIYGNGVYITFLFVLVVPATLGEAWCVSGYSSSTQLALSLAFAEVVGKAFCRPITLGTTFYGWPFLGSEEKFPADDSTRRVRTHIVMCSTHSTI